MVRCDRRCGLSNAERHRLAQEFLRPVEATLASPGGDTPGVTLEAAYRETEDAGRHVEGYAGAGMGTPLIVRLVEWDGSAAEATLEWCGELVAAFKTNLLGAPTVPLAVEGSKVNVPMRGHEIATVYVDLVESRKQARDLDAKREVWATVHRR